MSILTWNDQLMVGIDSVDHQHQHLVVLINRLDEVVTLGAEEQTIVDTVNELVDYTVYHFQHEEELMQKADYNPEMFAKHREQHQEFVDKMLQRSSRSKNRYQRYFQRSSGLSGRLAVPPYPQNR